MKSTITNLSPGVTIHGKWHQKVYRIVKRLGHGAIGVVYLAQCEGKYVALKISEQAASITTEVNVLKAFGKVQGANLGPSLLDVDDWAPSVNKQYSFYVMEYLHGVDLNTFLKSKGYEWLFILIIQLLDDLDHLHRAGWVFGDLKPENLIVTKKPIRLRWIDVGGTTIKGRAVKEYTEFYDRGYWGFGSRKADPKYDLFAVAMVIVQAYYPNRFDKGANPQKTLKSKISLHKELRKYAFCLHKAMEGSYASSKEMKQDLSKIILARQKQAEQTSAKKGLQHIQSKQTTSTNSHSTKWMESLGLVMVSAIVFMFFLLLSSF